MARAATADCRDGVNPSPVSLGIRGAFLSLHNGWLPARTSGIQLMQMLGQEGISCMKAVSPGKGK